ncbi:MAG TPA: hypothetical protein VGL93_17695 [Streptosporangiaceae bacterium]|jgi:hypothetical protein
MAGRIAFTVLSVVAFVYAISLVFSHVNGCESAVSPGTSSLGEDPPQAKDTPCIMAAQSMASSSQTAGLVGLGCAVIAVAFGVAERVRPARPVHGPAPSVPGMGPPPGPQPGPPGPGRPTYPQ